MKSAARFTFPLPLILLVACSTTNPKTTSAPQPPWLEQSNKIAREYSLDDAERYPEGASALGFTEYDSKAIQLEDDMETKDLAQEVKWKGRLSKEAQTATDPNYKIDIEVLQKNVENSIAGKKLDEKYGDIPFYPASKKVFKSLRELINEQSGADRKSAAVDRFKAYVNGHGKFAPLLEAYQSRILYREKNHPRLRLYPLKTEVEQYLSETNDYLKGVHQLLEKSGRKDWEQDFNNFTKQVENYDAYIRSHYLPKARKDYRLPREVYAYLLKVRGIDSSPEELIQMATADYQRTYLQYRKLAKEVAKKHDLKATDPVSVIKFLKSKPITKTEDVKILYQNAADNLNRLIVEKNLVSLPKQPLKIRFAGLAESKANPVPSLILPPLIGNRGERPEFLVPSTGSEKLPFDDFSYEAAALILTAHEGRPGHDLQFSSMLDNGVSTVRARYAFNNVNVEGWALYAEDLVFPYVPLESQFVATQTRLWRIARAFLDPQIQLGKIKPARVKQVFTKELGVSDTMADLELRRYTYEDPGQAPSYYYGLKKLWAARDSVEKAVGPTFNQRCFNDAVLSMGLLPVDLVAKTLVNNLKCEPATVH